MLRLRSIRGGTVAFSLRQACDTMKAKPSTPETTNRAMIRPSLHAYLEPPHSSANSKETTAGAIRMKPKGSSCLNLPNQLSAFLSGGGVFGVNRTSKINDTTPTGRLIQKHQRHVTDVRYPPSMGPMADDIPNTDPRAPKYFGRD